MAGSTTTGSAVINGTVDGGLQRGCGQMAGEDAGREGSNKIMFVYGNPQNVITTGTGSQLVHDIENKDFYMSVAQNGSSWNRLGSLS